MLAAYLEKEAFDRIAFYNEEDFPRLKRTLHSNIPIILNLSDEEFEKELEDDESPLSLFLLESASGKIPYALNEFFIEIQEDPQVLEHKPNALYVLNISKEEAKQRRQDYGVLIYSNNEINDTCLSGGFSQELEKGTQFKDGWKGVFKHPFHRGNSLIISDSYLFQNEINLREHGREVTYNKGIENIKQLLDAFLPENLSVSYQITILADNNPKNSQKAPKSVEWWTRIFGSLKAHIQTLRPYHIEVELFLTETVHKRILISNYIYAWADKGFDIFHHSKKEEVNDGNSLDIHHWFNNVFDFGDTYADMACKRIRELKEKCKNASDYVNNTNKQSIDFMVLGDCDTKKMTKNRLLN